MAAIRDDGGNTHYTRSRDIFDDAVSTLTLSKSLINNVDGEKLGVLAIRLNQEPSMDILNAAYSTLPGRKWIMDNEGQQITNEREAVNPQTLANVAPDSINRRPFSICLTAKGGISAARWATPRGFWFMKCAIAI